MKLSDVLRVKFPDHVTCRRGEAESCDVTPCDFFLWSHVIREAVEGMHQPLCDLVMKTCIKRLRSFKRSRGVHLADIMYHD